MIIKSILLKLVTLSPYYMKIYKRLLISLFVLSSVTTFAQNSEFENYLKGGVDDANVLLGHYMRPALRGLGFGFNNGWYNTAKPHETLGFDITLSFNAAFVPIVDQSFEFVPAEYSNTRIVSGSSTLPTMMGQDSETILENYVNSDVLLALDPNLPLPPNTEIPLGTYPAPDGTADDFQDYTLNQIAVPSPIIQVGIGIIKGTEIKVRWLPEVNQDNVAFKYFGIGGIHSISQWIPAIDDLEFLDISAFVGWTSIKAEYAIPAENAMEMIDPRAAYEVKTLSYQLIASAHISVITGYVGIGMDNFKTNFKLLGTYIPYPQFPSLIPEDPIELSESGEGGFRTTFGARLKLSIFTLHADYTIREYNTFTAGLGFSVK